MICVKCVSNFVIGVFQMEHMGAETQLPHRALHNTNSIFKMCLD